MEIVKVLCGVGFQLAEAKVYVAALELGEAPASNIAKKARINRSSAYVILKTLMKKGAVGSYARRGVTYFVARDPKLIIGDAVEKAKAAENMLPYLATLVPSEYASKPKVQYFEGYDGLISIMDDTLVTPNKTIFCWADINLAWETLGDYYPQYIRKKNERNIFVKGIFVEDEMAETFQARGGIEKRDVCLVPREKFPMSNEINIYDDKVSIISHKDLMGVMIQNKEIAETQRSIFKLGWELASSFASGVQSG